MSVEKERRAIQGRNRILAVTRGSIPYVKELRRLPLVRSISACVLMQQLDYWFNKYPNGFYKFLEPCNQPAYKEGDSWREELGISDDEFRTAFDQIGVRYESKKKFDEAKTTGDVFKGRYYCSYTDKISRLTWYFRNDEVVDRALNELLSAGEVGEANSPKPILSGSGSLANGVTQIGLADAEYTETTTQETTTEIIKEYKEPAAFPSFSSLSQDSDNLCPTEESSPPGSNPAPTSEKSLGGSVSSGQPDVAAGSFSPGGGSSPFIVSDSEPFGQVFSDWCAVMEQPDAVANKKRKTAVCSRLKEGYTVDDLKLATRGVLFSKWHMGENDAKAVYSDLELICRDGVQVEKFRQLARANGVKPTDRKRKSDFAKSVNSEGRQLHWTLRCGDEKQGCYWLYPDGRTEDLPDEEGRAIEAELKAQAARNGRVYDDRESRAFGLRAKQF